MTSTSPDHYHHGNLAEALLAAVGDIIASDGVEAVSLRAAARRVGVSHAAPTHHFGDKRGLLTAFAARGFRRFARALRDAAAAPGPDGRPASPEQQLLASGRAYVRFALEQRHYFDVMFRHEFTDFDDPELHEAGEEAFGVLLELVAACRADGLVDDPDTRRLALAAWSFTHGLAHLLVDGPIPDMEPDVDVQAALDGVVPVLLGGLRGEPGWRPDDAWGGPDQGTLDGAM